MHACWSQAEFTTANTLQLTGVTPTVQFYDKYEQGMLALHTPNLNMILLRFA